jgi:Uma2 family endonuclease
MTEAQYLAIETGHETNLEYYDGAAWEKGVVDRRHRILAGEFTYHFGALRRRIGGEQGPEGRVRLPGGTYRMPDAAYWLPGVSSGEDSLPTVAVEIRSPDETMASQRRKCRDFRAAGVPVCWLVDPISRTVEVYEGDLDGEPLAPDAVLSSGLLPGFEVKVADLWAAID